jgi:predicted acetyltransferase
VYASLPTVHELRLRPVRDGDEQVARVAQVEFEPDGFPFLLGRDPGQPWPAYVRQLARERRGLDLPLDRVASAFLLAHLGPEVVGRVSIRFTLTPWLRERGGHVGYGIRPAFRGRGYAREVLRQALVVARAEGVERVLLVCDQHNAASAAVIVGCGGVEEAPFVDEHGEVHRRFWID